jgi:hypothetical protein
MCVLRRTLCRSILCVGLAPRKSVTLSKLSQSMASVIEFWWHLRVVGGVFSNNVLAQNHCSSTLLIPEASRHAMCAKLVNVQTGSLDLEDVNYKTIPFSTDLLALYFSISLSYPRRHYRGETNIQPPLRLNLLHMGWSLHPRETSSTPQRQLNKKRKQQTMQRGIRGFSAHDGTITEHI